MLPFSKWVSALNSNWIIVFMNKSLRTRPNDSLKIFDFKKNIHSDKVTCCNELWWTHNGRCQDFQWITVINVWPQKIQNVYETHETLFGEFPSFYKLESPSKFITQLHQRKTDIKVWNDLRISKWVFRLEWTVSWNVFVSETRSSLFDPIWSDWIKCFWLRVCIQMCVLKRKKLSHVNLSWLFMLPDVEIGSKRAGCSSNLHIYMCLCSGCFNAIRECGMTLTKSPPASH